MLGRQVTYGILLAEIDPTFGTIGFNADRFRPVVSRKTSIAVFEAMLKKVPATAAPTAKHIPAERGGVS